MAWLGGPRIAPPVGGFWSTTLKVFGPFAMPLLTIVMSMTFDVSPAPKVTVPVDRLVMATAKSAGKVAVPLFSW